MVQLRDLKQILRYNQQRTLNTKVDHVQINFPDEVIKKILTSKLVHDQQNSTNHAQIRKDKWKRI